MSDLSTYPQPDVLLSPAGPPAGRREGLVVWVKKNLFSTPFSGMLTIAFTLLAASLLQQFLSFSIFNAVWTGGSEGCRANPDGACWPFIAEKLSYLR